MIEHYIIPTFSSEWFLVNFISISIMGIFLFSGLKICKNIDQKMKLGFFIGCILLLRILLIHPYQIHIDIWDKVHSLPLHLCGISAIISSFILFKFNQILYEFLILLGIPGAFQALLTPELTLGYDRVLLVEYFVSHGGIILSGLYLTYVLGHRPRIKSWLKVAVISQILLFFIHILNGFLNSNYMYTRMRPEVDNILIIGEHPYQYYIGFEIFGLLNIILFYFLFTKTTQYQLEK